MLAKGEHIPSLQEDDGVVVTTHNLLGLAGKRHLDRDTTGMGAKGRKRRERSTIHTVHVKTNLSNGTSTNEEQTKAMETYGLQTALTLTGESSKIKARCLIPQSVHTEIFPSTEGEYRLSFHYLLISVHTFT